MNQEQSQPHPVEQHTGMTPEQQAEAASLYNKSTVAFEALKDQERHRHDIRNYTAAERMRGNNPHFLDVAGNLGLVELASEGIGTINHAVKQHNFNFANRTAKRHYSQLEGAYQEQALSEATEAGVDVMGWDKPKVKDVETEPVEPALTIEPHKGYPDGGQVFVKTSKRAYQQHPANIQKMRDGGMTDEQIAGKLDKDHDERWKRIRESNRRLAMQMEDDDYDGVDPLTGDVDR